jgi:peptidoglycan/LPS O-acetylase OafA/YrhL
LCRFDELLPGVAIAILECFHPATFARVRRHGQLFLSLGILSSVAVLYCLDHRLPGPLIATAFGFGLLALSFAMLVLAALSPASLLHRVRVPGAASLALWSYAIYLVHKPLFMLIAPKLARFRIDAGSWIVIAPVMALGIGGGWLLFRFVETPFMQLRARWFPPATLRLGARLAA